MAGRDSKLDPKDVIKDIIFFFITVGVTYGYILLILLIFSFMFVGLVSVLGLDFDRMLVISGIGAGISAVWYVFKMVKKYSA